MISGPATKLAYTVAGRTIVANTYDAWSSLAISQLFSGWFLNPLPSQSTLTPDIILNMWCGVTPPAIPSRFKRFEVTHGGTCHTDNETYYIEFGDSLVRFGPGSKTEVSLWVDQTYSLPSETATQLLSHAVSPALRRCNVFEMHSAGVVAPGHKEAIMIAGPSGSGKSTLTSQLARSGWGYLSDDILLLTEREQNIQVQPFRRFFALTPKTMEATKLQSTSESSARKERVTPQEYFQRGPIEAARPSTIIFPEITNSTRSEMRALSLGESMQKLLRLCPWATYDKPTSAEHLRILGRLVNETAAFEFKAGVDVLKDSDTAAELVTTVFNEFATSK